MRAQPVVSVEASGARSRRGPKCLVVRPVCGRGLVAVVVVGTDREDARAVLHMGGEGFRGAGAVFC